MIEILRIETDKISGASRYQLSDGNWYNFIETANLISQLGCINGTLVKGKNPYIRSKSGYSIQRGNWVKTTISQNVQPDMFSRELPSIELLETLSEKTGFDKSIGNISMEDVTIHDIMRLLEKYEKKLDGYYTTLCNWEYRIKSANSLYVKIKKYLSRGAKLRIVLNDLLGFRILVADYNIEIPPYYKTVDLTKGKSEDDGYRAIHLYYLKDNYHLPIEVQIWADKDAKFNRWSHELTYKNVNSKIMKLVREEYDSGSIADIQEFDNCVNKYSRKGVE
jgi:putative GTP pyrophosphokinase